MNTSRPWCHARRRIPAPAGIHVDGAVAGSACEVPVCAQSFPARPTAQIAAWKSSYRGVQKMGRRPRTQVHRFAGSGPYRRDRPTAPVKNKYGYMG